MIWSLKMALEDLTGSSKFIDDLVATNPVGATDPKSEGDDHIRGLKNVLKNCFAAITGAITATQAEINSLAGRITFIDTFLQSADESAARAAIDCEQADVDILKADTADNLEVGFTSNLEDLGIVSSGTTVLSFTTPSIKKLNVQGDFTLQQPGSGNGYIELKITNGGVGPHTITLSGITQLSGVRNAADGGIDLWRLSRIDGTTYLEVVNVS